MATLRVNGMDDRLYRALNARAVQDNRSVSQEVVTMIREFLSNPRQDPLTATKAFLELAGSWADDRPARQIAGQIRKARRP